MQTYRARDNILATAWIVTNGCHLPTTNTGARTHIHYMTGRAAQKKQALHESALTRQHRAYTHSLVLMLSYTYHEPYIHAVTHKATVMIIAGAA